MIVFYVLQGLSGIGFIINIILLIPVVLVVIAIISILKNKRIKAFIIISGIVMIIFWITSYLIYSIGKMGSSVGIKYSFTFSFYMYLVASITVFLIGIALPERKLIEKNGYIIIKKEIDKNYYNIGLKIANVLLLIILLFKPLLQFNPKILWVIGTVKDFNNIFVSNEKVDFVASKGILYIRFIMTTANIVLKIIPIILIVVYLIRNKKVNGNLTLNKSTTVYVLIIFGMLWFSINGMQPIVVIANSLYLVVFISLGLMVANSLVEDKFKITVENAKRTAGIVKKKTLDATILVKQKSSDTIPIVRMEVKNMLGGLLHKAHKNDDKLKRK
ncbi:MAG: hypothetical protein H7Y18_20300 [Clostridiaceae bacterium]|nr:hypothetical protein [Clostridiaceae bacterium]